MTRRRLAVAVAAVGILAVLGLLAVPGPIGPTMAEVLGTSVAFVPTTRLSSTRLRAAVAGLHSSLMLRRASRVSPPRPPMISLRASTSSNGDSARRPYVDAIYEQLLYSAVSCAGLIHRVGRPAEPRRIGLAAPVEFFLRDADSMRATHALCALRAMHARACLSLIPIAISTKSVDRLFSLRTSIGSAA
ncbi:hypothetical protein [Rhodococcus sp. Q1]|uniref:hypothetical protein n=1 Tax=Rhodococcus TaxID=1827 RepID=UPI0010202D75|nr:hypothetical protein [Rhodococcus sp. Q1]